MDKAIYDEKVEKYELLALVTQRVGKSPLSNVILDTEQSEDIVQQKISRYKDTVGDPCLHVITFENMLLLYIGGKALQCKLFPMTL